MYKLLLIVQASLQDWEKNGFTGFEFLTVPLVECKINDEPVFHSDCCIPGFAAQVLSMRTELPAFLPKQWQNVGTQNARYTGLARHRYMWSDPGIGRFHFCAFLSAAEGLRDEKIGIYLWITSSCKIVYSPCCHNMLAVTWIFSLSES